MDLKFALDISFSIILHVRCHYSNGSIRISALIVILMGLTRAHLRI